MEIKTQEVFGNDCHIWIDTNIMTEGEYGSIFDVSLKQQDKLIKDLLSILTNTDFNKTYLYIGDDLNQSKLMIMINQNLVTCHLNITDYEFATIWEDLVEWQTNFATRLSDQLKDHD